MNGPLYRLAGGRNDAGMTLIELMVAITIALVMSLAIFSTLATSEGRKRTLTASNDVGQVGTFAAYQLDKLLRSAGSGFSQSAAYTYGCQLQAKRTSPGVILPFQGTMSAPFAAMNLALAGSYRLAPLVIYKDATTPAVSGKKSDALIVMSGAAGFGEVPTLFTTAATATQLNLTNTVAFQPNDLVLLADTAGATGPAPCMIQQVGPTFGGSGNATTPVTALPLAGTYTANPIGSVNVTGYSSVAMAMSLGSSSTANPPAFSLIGVGDDNNLMLYDLLQLGTYNAPQPLAEAVFELHALYGVDGNGDGAVDVWIDPGTAGYTAATLESGAAASVATLQKIKAVRIGLILRTSLPEKSPASGKPPATTGPLTLFSDLGSTLTYSRALSTTEQNFRYRTVELTVPLRNALLLN
ncbi:MAG: PilW family protein [Herminiimonas sp.]|nr:PilW family protein [Herminiimonas sp.]